jgi:hypothetical protein
MTFLKNRLFVSMFSPLFVSFNLIILQLLRFRNFSRLNRETAGAPLTNLTHACAHVSARIMRAYARRNELNSLAARFRGHERAQLCRASLL